MTQKSPVVEIEELMRLYFHTLDLSRDVDRNNDDTGFRDDRGNESALGDEVEPDLAQLDGLNRRRNEIWYVFDSTVLEVFINPGDDRGAMSSLHTPDWNSATAASSTAKRYVAQTALSTTEYLLSGELPGQPKNTIYMTGWHRQEFIARANEIAAAQVALIVKTSAQDLKKQLDDLRAIQADLLNNPTRLNQGIDDELRADLEAYRKHNPDEQALWSYLAVRRSLDILANDPVAEPARQLKRLLQAPMRNYFRTLDLAMSPNRDENTAIEADSVCWTERLTDECGLHDIEIVRSRQRSGGLQRTERAVANDANTLAFVRWAAAKISRNHLKKRLVFVTADQVLFDAYRRWYVNLSPRDQAYYEPFALRRLTQYAPVFNLIHSGRVEGRQFQDLFVDLQIALETMLLPLNLSNSSQAPHSAVARMRELTALRRREVKTAGEGKGKLKGKGPISEDPMYLGLRKTLEHNGVEALRRELGEILDRWRELERSALGRADDYIQHRIKLAMVSEKFAEDLDREVSLEAYRSYISDLVENLVSESQAFSVPLAFDFLDNWPERQPGKIIRVPIALNIATNVSADGTNLDVSTLLDRHLAGSGRALFTEAQREELSGQPALVFALASVRCLVSNDWSNAFHFAELALLEFDGTESPTKEQSDQLYEIKYLFALVNRFRLGEAGAIVTGDSYEKCRRHFNRALRQIDECAAYHDKERDSLRLMRALSERAALNLFYSAAFNPIARKIARARLTAAESDAVIEVFNQRRAISALERAEADLVLCMLKDVSTSTRNPSSNSFRARVQRQYYTNIAAAAAIRELWGLSPNKAPAEIRVTSPMAQERVKHMRSLFPATGHPMMQADILAFEALRGDRIAAAELRRQTVPEVAEGVLMLDSILISTLVRSADQFLQQGLRAASDRPSNPVVD